MSFSFLLSTEKKKLAESYVKFHAQSLVETFKKALFEKIEREFKKPDRYSQCMIKLRIEKNLLNCVTKDNALLL